MNRLKSVAILMALFFSFASYPGVRIILGGGGFAEMVLNMEFRSLERILRSFKFEPTWQTLTSEEKYLIEQVTSDSRFHSVAQTPLLFTPQQRTTFAYLPDGSLQYNMAELYDSKDQPRAIADLVRLAWRGFIHSPQWSQSISQWDKAITLIEARLVDLTRGRTKLQSLKFTQPEVSIHLVSGATQGGANHVSLLAEFAAGTVDITEKLLQAIPCSAKGNFALKQIKGFRKVDGHVLANLIWRCEDTWSKAQLLIQVPNVPLVRFVDELNFLIYSARTIDPGCEGRIP